MIYYQSTLNINDFCEGRKKCQKKFKNPPMLAWMLLSNSCAKLINYLKNIIFSQEFLSRHKKSSEAFTRNRKLPFHTLIFFLINLIKGSCQDELDRYFQAIHRFEVAKRIVSKVALSKARMKLGYTAFIELNRHLADYFYRKFKPLTWHGFNLLAVDGTTLRLPRIEAIAKHFGAWNPRNGGECPMARGSQLFDSLNKISLDAIISPKEIGERELAAQHFLNLIPEDLVLLDRGYPAYWLFNLILSLDANFCARISYKKWKVIRKFYNSGKTDTIISLPAPGTSIRQCREMGLDILPLKLRLIRVELDTGETEILITSLLEQKAYPTDIFMELYHKRWPVEEDYKTMKCWLEVENFSGKSVLSVYQDFHAKVFSKNLTSVLAFPTREIIEQNSKNCKYPRQINFTQALSKVKNVIVLLFNHMGESVTKLISDLHEIFIRTTEPIRPGRKFPRNHKSRRKLFYLNYKPVS